jgi:hypothetical protein
MALMFSIDPSEIEMLWWGIGAVPVIIGLGFLVIWKIESKKS